MYDGIIIICDDDTVIRYLHAAISEQSKVLGP